MHCVPPESVHKTTLLYIKLHFLQCQQYNCSSPFTNINCIYNEMGYSGFSFYDQCTRDFWSWNRGDMSNEQRTIAQKYYVVPIIVTLKGRWPVKAVNVKQECHCTREPRIGTSGSTLRNYLFSMNVKEQEKKRQRELFNQYEISFSFTPWTTYIHCL